MRSLTVKEAIVEVLQESKKPLHIIEITNRIIETNLYRFNAKNPPSSVGPGMYSDIKHNPDTPYIQVAPAIFALKNY